MYFGDFNPVFYKLRFHFRHQKTTRPNLKNKAVIHIFLSENLCATFFIKHKRINYFTNLLKKFNKNQRFMQNASIFIKLISIRKKN